MLGDLDLLELEGAHRLRRAGSCRRRSWGRGRGAGRRPARRCVFGHVGEPGQQQFDGARAAACSRGRARGRRGRAPGRSPAAEVAVPATAMPRLTARALLGGQAVEERRADVRARAPAAPRARADRSGCGARSCARRPTCSETWKPAVRPRRRRTRSSRRRCRSRPSARVGGRAARHRAEERQLRLFLAAQHPRVEAVARSRTRAANCGAVGGVAHGRGEHRQVRLAAMLVDRAAVLGEGARTRARSASSESEPAASTPSPSRVTCERRDELLDRARAAASTSAISRRVELVPMSTTATRTRRILEGAAQAG